MSNFQEAHSGGADAQQHVLDNQTNLFLFDLKNEAAEHGLVTSEAWTLQLATDGEIAGLKKEFYPLISLKLQPTALLKVFQSVKTHLRQSLSKDDSELTAGTLSLNEKKYLVAYSAKNTRK